MAQLKSMGNGTRKGLAAAQHRKDASSLTPLGSLDLLCEKSSLEI